VCAVAVYSVKNLLILHEIYILLVFQRLGLAICYYILENVFLDVVFRIYTFHFINIGTKKFCFVLTIYVRAFNTSMQRSNI
jgi:hypothetical protein